MSKLTEIFKDGITEIHRGKYVRVMVLNLIGCVYVLYRYGVLSCLGILMIIATHELGHYMCAVIKGRNPEFIVSNGGSFGVRYGGGWATFITAGGMIANFLFLPILVGMGIMDMNPLIIALLIIGGSLSDISKIVKELRKSE